MSAINKVIHEAIQVFLDNKLSGRITLHIKEGKIKQIEKTDFTHIKSLYADEEGAQTNRENRENGFHAN